MLFHMFMFLAIPHNPIQPTPESQEGRPCGRAFFAAQDGKKTHYLSFIFAAALVCSQVSSCDKNPRPACRRLSVRDASSPAPQQPAASTDVGAPLQLQAHCQFR